MGVTFALWGLGMAMAARYMAHTRGPTLASTPFLIYLVILLLWPLWVLAWIVCDIWEGVRR